MIPHHTSELSLTKLSSCLPIWQLPIKAVRMHKSMTFFVLLLSSSFQKSTSMLSKQVVVPTRCLTAGRKITRTSQHLSLGDFDDNYTQNGNISYCSGLLLILLHLFTRVLYQLQIENPVACWALANLSLLQHLFRVKSNPNAEDLIAPLAISEIYRKA